MPSASQVKFSRKREASLAEDHDGHPVHFSRRVNYLFTRALWLAQPQDFVDALCHYEGAVGAEIRRFVEAECAGFAPTLMKVLYATNKALSLVNASGDPLPQMPADADIELEEFSVSMFDFDQDWADGSKAYLREYAMISGFESIFVTNTSAVDLVFGDVPVIVPTAEASSTSANFAYRHPISPTTLLRPGVTVRSKHQGTGQPFATKLDYDGCLGACQVPRGHQRGRARVGDGSAGQPRRACPA